MGGWGIAQTPFLHKLFLIKLSFKERQVAICQDWCWLLILKALFNNAFKIIKKDVTNA
jgi:hypothetical protein